jgi:hypothetical protein
MKGKDYLVFINIAGAVCSILALFLTLSQNMTIAIVLKSLVAIVFFIATAGTIGAFAYSLNKKFIKSDYWPYHLLYWLIIGMTILFVSLFVAAVSYNTTTVLLEMFTSIIHSVQVGTI